MMLINAIVAPSRIHGQGLFTLVDIKVGDKLWAYAPGMDKAKFFESATDEQKHEGYRCPLQPDLLILCGDNAKFWNFPPVGHAANCIRGPFVLNGDYVIIAARDISAGEELTIEPASDLDYHRKLGLTPSN